jgi:uncharacterized protein YuzE
MKYIYYKDNQITDEPQPIKFLHVYENHNDEIDNKIIEFWRKENALPNNNPEFINQRLNDVLFIALNESDEIVGVSSGTPMYFEQIRNHFLYFRLFVREDYRGNNRGVAIGMYYATFDLFNQLKKIKDRNIIGILIVYESQHLNKVINYYHSEKYRNQVFIGWTPKNEQIRITYFNDIKMF